MDTYSYHTCPKSEQVLCLVFCKATLYLSRYMGIYGISTDKACSSLKFFTLTLYYLATES